VHGRAPRSRSDRRVQVMPSLDLIARFIGVDASMGRELDRMSGKADATALSLSKLAKASALGLGALAIGSIKAAADYQKLTVNLVTGAGEQERNLKMVQQGMLSMAGQVGYSADTLAKAMYTVESAGFHGANALNLLKTAAEGAKVDNADLTTVVDALTSAMNAYHTPTADAAKVTNTLIASASVGKMHLQDLTDALGTVLPSAAALKIPLDQVGAAMATMTEQGTNANRAATYLRFSIAALANPTSKAQGEMKLLGISSNQVATEIMHGGLPGVFTLLEDAAGKKFPAGSAKYLAALANMVGGTRGLQSVLELTGQHLVTMDNNLTVIDGRVRSAGNKVSDWSEIQKNFNQQLDEFGARLQADAIGIGDKLLPAATDLLHVFSDTIGVVGNVTRFFQQNEEAAIALGIVASATLLPKLLTLATSGFETVALKAMYMKDALIGSEAAMAGAEAEAGALALAFNPVTLVLAAAGAAAYEMNKRMAQANKQGIENFNRFASVLMSNRTSLTANSQATQTLGQIYTFLNQGLLKNSGLTKDAKEKFDQQSASTISLAHNIEQLRTVYGFTHQQVVELAASGVNLKGSWQSVSAAVMANLTPTQQLTGAEKALQSAAEGSQNAIASLTTVLNNLVGNTISADQQQNAFAAGLRSLKTALDKSHDSLSRTTKAGLDARDQFDSLIQTILSSAAANEKLTNGGQVARKMLLQQIDALKALGSNSPYVIAEIAKLTKALNNIPSRKAGEQTGSNYGAGLLQGLQRSLKPVGDAAYGLASQINKNAMEALGEHSPSKKAIKAGQWYAQGLAIGMNSGGHEVYLSSVQVAHQIAVGLTEGFTGEAVKVKDTYSEAIQSMLSTISAKIAAGLTKQQDQLKTFNQKLTSDLKARQQAISSLTGSIAGNADISNMLNQSLTVGSQTVNFTGNIKSYLGGEAALLKREAHLFGRLRKMGLSPALLTQISGLAPSDAITVMQQILSGSDGSIRTLNALETSIRSSSKQIATGAVNSPHELHKLEADRREIHQQTELLRKINEHLAHFRANPQGTVALTLSLHELGLSKHQVAKILQQIEKLRRQGHPIPLGR